ncbi:MAG: BC1872 family protein [Blastocatellia bacterium]
MNIGQNIELDTLVAERVLDLVPCDGWESINLGSAGGPAMVKNCGQTHRCYPRGRPMAASSMIAPAWHVVSHLGDKGWEITIRCFPGADVLYEARIDRHGGEVGDTFAARSGVAPMAICEAALRACGYNEPLPR